MTEEQPMDEVEEQVLRSMQQAVEAGGVPIAMVAYDGPPPDPEFQLSLMREMVETTGEVTGALLFGTTDGTSGLFPLLNCQPQQGLVLLIAMREQRMFGAVSWVVLASDVYRKAFTHETDPDSIHHGDLEKMRDGGDPEVEDALMVLCLQGDERGWDVSQGYTRTEAGIEWGEVETAPDETMTEGAIRDLMTRLVTA